MAQRALRRTNIARPDPYNLLSDHCPPTRHKITLDGEFEIALSRVAVY